MVLFEGKAWRKVVRGEVINEGDLVNYVNKSIKGAVRATGSVGEVYEVYKDGRSPSYIAWTPCEIQP